MRSPSDTSPIMPPPVANPSTSPTVSTLSASARRNKLPTEARAAPSATKSAWQRTRSSVRSISCTRSGRSSTVRPPRARIASPSGPSPAHTHSTSCPSRADSRAGGHSVNRMKLKTKAALTCWSGAGSAGCGTSSTAMSPASRHARAPPPRLRVAGRRPRRIGAADPQNRATNFSRRVRPS